MVVNRLKVNCFSTFLLSTANLHLYTALVLKDEPTAEVGVAEEVHTATTRIESTHTQFT